MGGSEWEWLGVMRWVGVNEVGWSVLECGLVQPNMK